MHDNLGTEFHFDTRVPTRACYHAKRTKAIGTWLIAIARNAQLQT